MTTRNARQAPDVIRLLPPGALDAALREDVHAGLTATPKTLRPTWFYDEYGSRLFDEITRLDEYYPTRAEREILTRHAGDIADALPALTLVELGAGTADKTRVLLDAYGTRLNRYVPVDVSEDMLVDTARRLGEEYPALDVQPVVADFNVHPPLPYGEPPQLTVFLGGTIGNLVPAERAALLRWLASGMRPGDGLLLGTDLVKDTGTLVRAYDDAAGVTAAFNRNVLTVLNRELGADFDPDAFEHVAVWNADEEWIEMRLRARGAQTVKIGGLGLVVEFADGEELRTETSAKFRPSGVAAELEAAGLTLRRWWTDTEGRFGLALAVPSHA